MMNIPYAAHEIDEEDISAVVAAIFGLKNIYQN